MTGSARARSKHRRRRRRGFLSLELALTLPILGLVLMAVFEFSLLLLARGELADASRAGARLATQPGVETAFVEQRVREALPPRFRQAAVVGVQLGERPGDSTTVAVRVPMRAASPDLLWPIGFGLRGRHLHAETAMLRE